MSGILLIALTICWATLLVIGGVRLTYLSNASMKNTDVGKKMQFFQAWFYSFFHTLVNVSTLFLAIGFALQMEFIGFAVIVVAYLFMNLYNSQIDVIGTIGKKQGVNNIDFLTFVEYLFTTYLAKAVWKVGGHEEFTEAENQKKAYFCLRNLHNAHRPKVYDFKDVVGIQGSFLALPALLTLFITYVRSVGQDSFLGFEEENPTAVIHRYDSFELLGLPIFSLAITFVASVLTPLLGDWETCNKKFLLAFGSVFFRSLELFARLSFFAYLVDATKFAGLLLLFAEILFMWFTTVYMRDSSAASRTNSLSHRILSSWASVFFVRYRRVHVDKEFNTENTSMMPFTVDFLRSIVKFASTVIGFFMISFPVGNISEAYVNTKLVSSWLFFASVGANVLLFIMLSVYYLGFERQSLSWQEASMVKNYWLTLQPCKFLFSPKVVHVNRDNVNFEAGGNPIHYV